jgi:hypothetical protein
MVFCTVAGPENQCFAIRRLDRHGIIYSLCCSHDIIPSVGPLGRSFVPSLTSTSLCVFLGDDCCCNRFLNKNGPAATAVTTTTAPKKGMQRLVSSGKLTNKEAISVYSAVHHRVVSDIAHCPPTQWRMFLSKPWIWGIFR